MRDHITRNPLIMVPHPTAQGTELTDLKPRSKTRFGPTFAEPEVIVIAEEDSPVARGREISRKSPDTRASSARSARSTRSVSATRSETARRDTYSTFAVAGTPLFSQLRLDDGLSFHELCRQWNNDKCKDPRFLHDRTLCPDNRLHVCAVCLGGHPHL